MNSSHLTPDTPREALRRTLQAQPDVAFAYLFGSAAFKPQGQPGSDLDIAVCFHAPPDLDRLDRLMADLETAAGSHPVDLLVLNGCENYILRHEVLKGERLVCRDADRHAGFFSWTVRMYEDEVTRMRRAAGGER